MITDRLIAASFYCIALGMVTAMGFSIYETPQFWVATTVSMIAGVLLAGIAFLRSWSALAQVGLTVVTLLALAVPLAAPSRAGVATWSLESVWMTFSAIWTSWRRLTTIDLPVGADDGLLMAPVTLVFVSTVVGIGIIMRTRRGELAMLLPLAVMFWALLWGPPEPAALPLTIGFAISVIVSVSALRQARRRRRAERTVSTLPMRFASGALAIALAVGIAVGAATVSTFGDRVVLREHPPQPRQALEASSPLAQFRSNFVEPQRDSVLMTVTGVEEGELISLASLSVYTGQVFAADTSRLLRTSGRATSEDAERQLGFTMREYEGMWLPTIGTPGAIAFAGPRSADLSQSLMMADDGAATVVLAGLRPEDGYSLLVSNASEPPSLTELSPAGSAERGTELPLSVLDWMAARSGQDENAGATLEAYVNALRQEGYLSHGIEDDEAPSRAGHSSARLDEMFSAEYLVGDQEQFATAAALMARELGFPSRVGVGYRASASGTVDIYGRDATAWVEILTSQGWVNIEIIPENTAPPETQDSGGLPSAQPQPPVPPALPEGGQQTTQQPGDQNGPAADDLIGHQSAWLGTAIRIALIPLIIALPFFMILALKALRRRSRFRGDDARERARGAWSEFVDALIDRGAPTMGQQTRREYAAGDQRVEEFAATVDRAVFGAEPPTLRTVADLWEQRERFIAEHDARRSFWQRLRATFSLNSLLGAHRTGFLRRVGSGESRAQQAESVHSTSR